MIGFDLYGEVKVLHILGATVLLGTGLGTAFQMSMAHRSGSPAVVARVARQTVIADWLFTTPAVILQPVTGLILATLTGVSLFEPWLSVSIGLYLFTGACWLPVVWIQDRMARLAAEAVRAGTPLPVRYYRLFRIWFILGWPAFLAVLGIVHLMVLKPAL